VDFTVDGDETWQAIDKYMRSKEEIYAHLNRHEEDIEAVSDSVQALKDDPFVLTVTVNGQVI
jgi:hypothetical protein